MYERKMVMARDEMEKVVMARDEMKKDGMHAKEQDGER